MGDLNVVNETLVVQSPGSVTGPGSLTVDSGLSWTGGAIGVGGGVTLRAGALTTSTGGGKTLACAITNENAFTNLGGTDPMVLMAGASIDNVLNAILTVSLPSISSTDGTGSITNTAGATFDVTSLSSAPTDIKGLAFTNDGYLKIESGDALKLEGPGSGGGPVVDLGGIL